MIPKRSWAITVLFIILVSTACTPQPANPSPLTQTGQETAISNTGIPQSTNTQPVSGSPSEQPTQEQDQPQSLAGPTQEQNQPQTLAGPIQVSLTLEESQAISSTLTGEGATLSAVSSNGVKYDLSLPAGALYEDTKIRMIPIEKMDGLPLSGGLIGGVQLEPEGAVLTLPAELTITLPSGTPPEEVIPLAYHGNGERVHLTIAKLEGDRLTFQIVHFSGYFSGQGTEEEADAIGNTPTGDPLDDIEQQAASHSSQSGSQGDYDPAAAVDYYRNWFNNTVYPNLLAAEANGGETVDAAAVELFTWAISVVQERLDDELAKELANGFTSAIRGNILGYENALGRCMAGDVEQSKDMLNHMINVEQWNGLYGGKAPSDFNFENKRTEFQSCLTFTMKIDSLATINPEGKNTTYKIHVTGEVILRLEIEYMKASSGSGKLKMESFDIEGLEADYAEDRTCTYTTSGSQTSTIEVPQAIIFKYDESSNSMPYMFITTGMFNCCAFEINCWWMENGTKMESNSNSGGANIPYWEGAFMAAHEDKFAENSGFFFEDFKPGSGQTYAILEDFSEASKYGNNYTDTLTLEIFHTPGK